MEPGLMLRDNGDIAEIGPAAASPLDLEAVA